MNQGFLGWNRVADDLIELARSNREIGRDRDGKPVYLRDGQLASIAELAGRLPDNGAIIADEVGMGKTLIAAMVAKSVIANGGRVAILVPPGLGYQWSDELRAVGVNTPPILRSLDAFLNAWKDGDGKKWGSCQAVLLSHVFCNWALKSNTKKNWRWALLPAVLKRLTQKKRDSGRIRIGTNKQKFDDARIEIAAQWIAENGAKKHLNELANNASINLWGDKSPLFDPANYTKDTEFRKGLETVVGAGLGIFDLIIIDEAHKSRGQKSNLNSLLNQIV